MGFPVRLCVDSGGFSIAFLEATPSEEAARQHFTLHCFWRAPAHPRGASCLDVKYKLGKKRPNDDDLHLLAS